jgi:2-oxoisovalerate dehydrogenase E1 component alpha subunit
VPSALNISSVHGCPTVFFCRNNGYAISTNSKDQYTGDGIAPRGVAFGMPTIRVDGNDLLAVIAATQRARAICLAEGTPTLIEAMTYRIGAHSTSDDDSKYRTKAAPEAGWDSERQYWEARSPIIRFGRYLASLGWYNVQMEDQIRKQARKEAIGTLNRAQAVGRPQAKHLYGDVYDELPWNLVEQQAALRSHLTRYREHYPNEVIETL